MSDMQVLMLAVGAFLLVLGIGAFAADWFLGPDPDLERDE